MTGTRTSFDAPRSLIARATDLSSAWRASAWYLVAALVLTWPVARGLLHDLPADLGDPLLNCWILHWDASHFLRFLSGDLGALRGFWNANIFHPSPLALAYSEHLVPQAIAILPVYALTGNLVLCYNLLFLSTFVLSGLGVYLLARSLTRNPRAAFVAGLLFAFSPYRLAQLPHVQVLSTQWMAFALYGLHRYFEAKGSGRFSGDDETVIQIRKFPKTFPTPLAGAAAALALQNLSCGYFLLFFAPFAAAFAAWELVRRRLFTNWRVIAELAVAGVAVALVTWPFLVPYLELRHLGYGARTFDEVRVFSANVLAYLTGPERIRGWGRLFTVYLGPEGELFPGLVCLLLAVVGVALTVRSAWAAQPNVAPRWRRTIAALAGAWALVQVALVVFLLAGGSRILEFGPLHVRLRDFSRAVLLAAASGGVWLAVSTRAREAGRRAFDTCGFWVLGALVAALLSFGPEIHTGLKEIAAGPYALLYQYVPGYDGLRVPARFGLVVTLMLTVLAAFGLDRLLRASRRAGLVFAAVVVLFVSETFAVPLTMNASGGTEDLRAPGPVLQGDRVPAVYRYLRDLPGKEPVIEFPFGDPGYELQYVYYTTEHGHPIVNGYSGIFPPRYMALRQIFEQESDWTRRWAALADSGARLAVVHEGAFLRPHEAQRVNRWLEAHGARLVATLDADKVYRLP